MVEGEGRPCAAAAREAEAALATELKALGSAAFPLVVVGPSLDEAAAIIVQAAGVGPVRANTILVNWPRAGDATIHPRDTPTSRAISIPPSPSAATC